MRLGARPTTITPKHPNGEASLATDVYGIEQGEEASVLERHRHRYEVNPDIVKDIQGSIVLCLISCVNIHAFNYIYICIICQIKD